MVWETLVSDNKFVFINCGKYIVLWAGKICWALCCHRTLHISMHKCRTTFFVVHFCNSELFYCVLPFWKKIPRKIDFILNRHTWKNILVCLKKFCHFGTRSYCLWNCICRKKIWTFIDYISWYLIGHMTIWIRFVGTKGGVLEALLPAMWSSGHQCIFQ